MKEIAKSKTAAKTITYKEKEIRSVVLETLKEASDLVGSTLGPNGKIALIERQENSLGPYTTKDGITVFNSMAYSDSTKQVVLEAARDSSSKTNDEAGDGTTTATILAEALVRLGFDHLSQNPKMSPQKVMRELEEAYSEIVEPFIKSNSVKINRENSKDLLSKVALVATNYDQKMSQAVIEAFEIVGHGGNMTVAETPGTSGFAVERIEGFHIARGFEESCGRFADEFINDRGNYKTLLQKPKFLLYNGKLNELGPLVNILEKVGRASDPMNKEANGGVPFTPNIVIVAPHFSDQILALLATNFKDPTTINVFPLKTPMMPIESGIYHFLQDLSHYTGAKLFDPLTKPLETANLEDLGSTEFEYFEASRYKSLLVGAPDEFLVIARAKELVTQLKNSESAWDRDWLTERLGILTGGIARIKVYGSSDAELKEKRHRVDDAIASVKGAIRHGVLPGCAKTLLELSRQLKNDPSVKLSVKNILGKAFSIPFSRILQNGGQHIEDITLIGTAIMNGSFMWTYDAMNNKFGDAMELGILDSAAAVNMAIKNSLSVSKMLMCLSGIVVFKRDDELDRQIASDISSESRAIAQAERENRQSEWEPN